MRTRENGDFEETKICDFFAAASRYSVIYEDFPLFDCQIEIVSLRRMLGWETFPAVKIVKVGN